MFRTIVMRTVASTVVALVAAGGFRALDAQGLTARVAPEFASYRWSESVGLSNADMFGGAATLGFGRYVFLRSGYSVAGSVPTSLAASGYGAGAAEENSVRSSYLSTDVQLRLGNGRIAPVLMGGGGVLDFTPDGRDRVQQVAVSYGGGLDARVSDWLDARVMLRDLRFRLDRSAVAGGTGGAPPPDDERDGVRRAVSLTASLGARIGGSRPSASADQLDEDVGSALSGGEGLMIPIEAHAGVVRFGDAFGLGDQSMAGLRAGLDFGPYFGLRGSYARGLTDGIGSLSHMSTWTGEAQFNVGKVTGVSPHLLLGFGQMTFWGDYVDNGGFRPDDRDVLIFGVGLGIPVSDRSRFIVALRDHVTSAGAPSGVSATSDLRHSFGLSTGLSFDLRGRRARLGGPAVASPRPLDDRVAQVAPPVATADTVTRTPAPPAGGSVTSPPSETSALAPQDSAQARPSVDTAVEAAAAQGVPAASTTSQPASSSVSASGDAAPASTPPAPSFQSDRVISVPIPTQGELYIRYGPPPQPATAPSATPGIPIFMAPQTASATTSAAASTDSTAIATLVRSELASTLGSEARLTAADLTALETRLTERLTASLLAIESARQSDSTQFAGAVQAELRRLGEDPMSVVTRDELAAMEARIVERATETSTPDTASVVTRADLRAMESRLAEQVASAMTAREVAATPTPTARTTDPEIDALTRQVEELREMLRQRELAAARATPLLVSMDPSGDVVLVNGPRGPVFRGAALRAGTHSVRDSGRGIGMAADLMVSSAWSGRLRPFVGVELGRSGVKGGLGAQAYRGHVTTYGGHGGASLDLPAVGAFAPSVTAGLVGLTGSVSGNAPSETTVIESLYEGFVMGPRLSFDAAWKQSDDARWSVVSSLGRTWAGARGGWTFQVGMRWLRRGYSAEVRPLFRATRPLPAAEPAAPAAQSTSPVETTQPSEREVVGEPSPQSAAPDTVVIARLDALQRALEEEREARLRATAVADSLEQSARAARARADSLARVDAQADRAERERDAAEAEARRRFISELSGLVGVVDGVQAVRTSDRGLEVILGGSLFPTGSGQLTPPTRARVERVAHVLARAGGYVFMVDGHTDSTGPDEANLVISRQRAEAVRAVLMGAGIAPERVVVQASGESAPIAGNGTALGRALNRRVEIVVIDYESARGSHDE